MWHVDGVMTWKTTVAARESYWWVDCNSRTNGHGRLPLTCEATLHQTTQRDIKENIMLQIYNLSASVIRGAFDGWCRVDYAGLLKKSPYIGFYGICMRRWLDRKFPGHLIGRHGPIEWPVRSEVSRPHPTWFLHVEGHLKVTYQGKRQNIDHIKKTH